MFKIISTFYIRKYILQECFSHTEGICDQMLRNVNLNRANCYFSTEEFLESFTTTCSVFFVFKEYLLEKEMAPHSSTLAWKIPWTEEPGRLPSYQVGKSPTRGRKELDTTERLYLLNTTENRGLENTIPQ